MKKVSLDNRLSAVASYIRNGSSVADIGTDHGLLCIYLVQNLKTNKAIACDINESPLLSAKKNVEQSGLCNKIELRLSNGLSAVNSNECDDIVIAGMGGELIAQIIDSCKWIKNPHYQLVLQPMTKADRLRKYLCENGFSIVDETAICENGKHYTVMSVFFSGKNHAADDIYLLLGELLIKHDEAATEHKILTLQRIEKQICGLSLAGGNTDRLQSAAEKIRGNINGNSRSNL